MTLLIYMVHYESPGKRNVYDTRCLRVRLAKFYTVSRRKVYKLVHTLWFVGIATGS